MQCIKIEPGKEPVVSEIDNTLTAMQAYVGGYIETVTLSDGLVVIVNEDGKYMGLPRTGRFLVRELQHDILCGNVLVCRRSGSEVAPVGRRDIDTVKCIFVGVKYESDCD